MISFQMCYKDFLCRCRAQFHDDTKGRKLTESKSSQRIIVDCDDPGLRDRNLTRIRNTKTDVTSKYKFIAVKPNQSNC